MDITNIYTNHRSYGYVNIVFRRMVLLVHMIMQEVYGIEEAAPTIFACRLNYNRKYFVNNILDGCRM